MPGNTSNKARLDVSGVGEWAVGEFHPNCPSYAKDIAKLFVQHENIK